MNGKKDFRTIGILCLAVLALSYTCVTESQRDYPIKPVPFTDVHIADNFWSPRMETNQKITIPYAFGKCEETGRINNFFVAGGLKEGTFSGIYPFDDSDVYKIIEGASYSLSIHSDPKLEKYLDDLIFKISAAQEEDGYLYTARTINPDPPVRWVEKERWSNLRLGHELYNAGHMYEAAVAHHLATGKRTLLDVAIKNANLVESVFGPDKKQDVPGHQVIEIGLAKLYRVTGDKKYLKLSKFFLDERGQTHGRKLYGKYAQDHKPVIEQSEAVGHAVRATYMYAGMADIAALTGDTEYINAIDRIWENVVTKKLYLTGGIGASGGGEAFGKNYELPNATAYNETCAAIGNVLWNHRLFLLHGDARYIDVLERVLYNGFLSGISLNGDRFFYPNPLESYGQHSRSPWFGCACCPSNITRFIPSIPEYVYAHQGKTLYVNLFFSGIAEVKMGKNIILIKQDTSYPWDGAIKMTVDPERSERFAIYVRIPGWAQSKPVPSDLYRYKVKSEEKVSLEVNGDSVKLNMDKGFARIRRKWKKGDVIELSLPMPIRRVLCNEKVEDNRGKVALERGPIVYCAEWPDNRGYVRNLVLSDDVILAAEARSDLLNGVTVIRGSVSGLHLGEDGKTKSKEKQEFTAIPYYAWAHRGKGEMAVWLAQNESIVRPLPGPTIASTSRVKASGSVNTALIPAVNDQLEPKNSNDHSIIYLHWWPRKSTREWVQYDFKKASKVSAVDVYWFDDTGVGECRVPKFWRVLYKDRDNWRPVQSAGFYGVEKDKFNNVSFKPVRTSALRIEVQFQENYSGGILEWRVFK